VANAPADPGNRALSEDNRRTSRAYNAVSKVVVSDNLKISSDNPWAQNTTVIPRAASAEWLDAARSEGDRDILIFASRIMWNGLLTLGLIDELHLMVSPTAIVEGVPVFNVPASLGLMECRRFQNSNNVLLRYSTRKQ
jgi:dihydrofolate reductase